MKKFAVIVAGGSGTRMGSAIPKQFLEVRNEPMVMHTARAFVNAFPDIKLILVVPESYQEKTRSVFQHFRTEYELVYVSGGASRFHSVQNGLKMVDDDGIVFIHDAVRCLVSPQLIRRCYTHAVDFGSAIPVVPVRDSLRIINQNGQNAILDRETVRVVQTPQTFRSALIKSAFQQEYQPIFTDEASVLEYSGESVSLINGEEVNIKVTYPEDLILAENIISLKRDQAG